MGKTILITGCAGFIGSNFAKWLLENTDHNVVGVDNFSTGYKENLPDEGRRFKFYQADICSRSFGNIVATTKPHVIYHAAAYASEGRSNHIRKFIHENNTVGTANVINACINNKCKLIFLSSVAVYSGMPPFTEEILPSPVDEYALSKFMSEKSIEIAGKEQNLDWCIIRPRNIYGPLQSIFDPSRNLMGIMCYNTLNNLPITIFGDGSHQRSFTYIDDILEPMYNALGVSNEIINLGSGKVYTVKEAVETFCKVSGYGLVNIVNAAPRPEVPNAYCYIEKSERMLGFEDITDLHTGIHKMWSWAKTIEMKPRMVPPELETTTNAHSSLL